MRGVWVIIQSALLFYAEFMITDTTMQFFVGFVLSLMGQYAIFFATTKGRVAQRIFTLLTYSIFFCISMALFVMVKGTFPQVNSILLALINGAMLIGIVYFFLRHICPLCRTATNNITTGWAHL